jgi:putative DNA primase/helicase
MQVLRRKWIVEMPEIDGLAKSEWSHVKAYFSRQVDTYRPSYGKGARDFHRQSVFCGSTNRSDYLGDDTGARRFHPVRCRMGNLGLAQEIRAQLWGEAVALYQGGVPWHVVDPELASEFKREQDDRYRAHPWEETIAAWLARPIDLPLATKRADVGVTTADVLEGACKIEVGRRTDSDSKNAAACLRRLGWRQRPPCRDARRGGSLVRLFFPADTEEPVTGTHELAGLPHAEPGWPSDDEMAANHGE